MRIERVKDEQCLLMVRDFKPMNAEFILATNHVKNKPIKALWTSTMEKNLEDVGWLSYSYSMERSKDKNSIFKIKPKDDVRVLVIENANEYMNEVPLIEDHTNAYRNRMGYVINYEEISKYCDGVHFTEAAAALGHCSFNRRIPWWVSDSLNCIDCESTVWFNSDWIDDYTYICEFDDVFKEGE